MLRYTPAFAALLTAASVSAQTAGSPQPGSPQRPGQTTQVQGADQNQTRDRDGARREAPQGTTTRALPPSAAPAQGQAGRQQEGRRGRAGQSVDERFDMHVADCLILGNQEEIALLKFGAERTKSDRIKEAAEMMVKDHEKAISELREFASPQHANDNLTAYQGGTNDGAATREARKVPAEGDDAQATGGRNTLMSKMHQMAKRGHEQCLILNREELTKYEGDEFDQAFLGQQLGAHIGMLAKLKAAQEETSPELSKWTVKAQETTKKHKDHLEKLMNESSKEAHSKK